MQAQYTSPCSDQCVCVCVCVCVVILHFVLMLLLHMYLEVGYYSVLGVEFGVLQEFPELVPPGLQLAAFLLPLLLGPRPYELLEAALPLPGVEEHVARIKHKFRQLLVPRREGRHLCR